MRPTPHPSPNQGARRGGALPDMVVIHFTGMRTFGAALERLCDPAAQVSAHYLVSASGEVLALVPEEQRAWHAGAGSWGAVRDVNSRSVGIELHNDGRSPFPAAQMAALEALLGAVMARWRVPPERVIGHSDMAPERKDDPGRRFDWRRLSLAGLAVWSDAAPGPGVRADWADLAPLLRQIGYPDADRDKLLAAFRARFRPWGAGPLDPDDLARARDIALRFPVDRTPSSA